MKISKLSNLKKGEYFRFEGKKKVYMFDGKVRMYTNIGKFKGWGYGYIPVDDFLSGAIEVFTDKKVETDFDY